MLAHPVCPRASGLIDMDTRRRLTRPRAADEERNAERLSRQNDELEVLLKEQENRLKK